MIKKNGFIAISIIYSFFIIFTLLLILIMNSYVSNRILISRATDEIKNNHEYVLVSKHNGVIPKGGTYYVAPDFIDDTCDIAYKEPIEAGNPFPEEPRYGDKYVYGDYSYFYNAIWVGGCLGTINEGWSVLTSLDKTSYGAILLSINNQPVTSMYNTFKSKSIVTAPVIPSSITDMTNAFEGCTSLVNAPKIPSNVINLDYTFHGCSALTGNLEIDANPLNYNYALQGTNISSVIGETYMGAAIFATKNGG